MFSVNDENKTVFRLDEVVENIGFHVDAFTRENDNVDIDGFAIDEVAVERLEELTKAFMEASHDDHDDDHLSLTITTMMTITTKKSCQTRMGLLVIQHFNGEAEGGTADFHLSVIKGSLAFVVSTRK